MDSISIYVHIPFCVKKCAYCDFLSAPAFGKVPAYISALLNEINTFKTDKSVKSIFMGGGTPSAVDAAYISQITECIANNFHIEKNCEISMEANPGTLDKTKLAAWRNAGINRLSMGVQSFDDSLLTLLGRIHSAADALQSYELACKYFDNINLDLMFALPTQSIERWHHTLSTVLALSPEHISAYSLIIEEGTPFYDMYKPVDEAVDRKMYYLACDMLAKNNYKQYEISNFAKPGRECRHNLVYWQGGDYKGFGLGAASLINAVRLKNTEDMAAYLNGTTIDPTETVTLSQADQMQEFVLLGLRCTDGINAETFAARFGCDMFKLYGSIFKKHQKNGLLTINGNDVKLTKKGIDLSNMVFVDFV